MAGSAGLLAGQAQEQAEAGELARAAAAGMPAVEVVLWWKGWLPSLTAPAVTRGAGRGGGEPQVGGRGGGVQLLAP